MLKLITLMTSTFIGLLIYAWAIGAADRGALLIAAGLFLALLFLFLSSRARRRASVSRNEIGFAIEPSLRAPFLLALAFIAFAFATKSILYPRTTPFEGRWSWLQNVLQDALGVYGAPALYMTAGAILIYAALRSSRSK